MVDEMEGVEWMSLKTASNILKVGECKVDVESCCSGVFADTQTRYAQYFSERRD